MTVFSDLVHLKQTGDDRFQAPTAPESTGRMYGGQFLAQGLAAACLTTDDDREVHSLHAYFLRAGSVEAPLDVEVDRVRDGRSFSAREVKLLQEGKELFRMMVSFHVPEDGDEYTAETMPDVPSPDSVATTYTEFSFANGEAPDWDGAARPMDLLYINPPDAPPGVPVTEPQRLWTRISEALPADPAIHKAGLAYLSDSTLVDHTVLPQGRRWQNQALNGASLDHAMWFHNSVKADDWLLFDQHVIATGHARGSAQGYFYDQKGRLIASCVQEGLIRWED